MNTLGIKEAHVGRRLCAFVEGRISDPPGALAVTRLWAAVTADGGENETEAKGTDECAGHDHVLARLLHRCLATREV
jgi:hypothetical protein